MARLAELEEIAQQEQEAEIARQAAELAGNNHAIYLIPIYSKQSFKI